MRVLVALTAFAAIVNAADETWSWKGYTTAGKTLEIKGVNGWIKAERGSANQIEVSVQKHGRRDEPSTVRLEVVEHADGVTICAVYPDVDGRANECKPGKGGRMNVKDNDVNVDFTIRVPDGVAFTGRTVNGRVEATSLTADIVASTVNGNIKIATTGGAQASTVNGSIDASFAQLNWTGTREFSTVNGSVDLTMPAGANVDVRASSVNGGISSDFPIAVRGQLRERSLQGTLGSGGRELKISTVNGAVHLKQLGGRAI